MGILAIDAHELRAAQVETTDTELRVTLLDGRTISTPLSWYPKLMRASPEQRANYEIMPMGIHWPDLDEDLSVAGMLSGQRAPGAEPPPGSAGA